MSSCVYTPSRGEIKELQQQLRDPQIEKDLLGKRAILRQVIALMTMGVDTSGLFTEMILACSTTDIVSKKLVYFYLINRSENNAELTLLSINTLTKECSEQSPLVRSLALRSLSSLRLPQLFDFLIPMLKNGLTDTSPQVRKTACLCVLKVFRISPGEFHRQRFFDRMLSMLHDSDPLVCSSALTVLLEISRDAEANGATEEVFEVKKRILYYLLNKLPTIPEFHQIQVINLVLSYTPSNEEEMFDIMNLLEERLQSHHSYMILAVSKVFFQLTQNYPTLHIQVFKRLKLPLFNLVSSCVNVEVSYVALCHIKLLVQREPSVFYDSFKVFYCHYTEPAYLKAVKIDILSLIATEASATGILEEFVAYVFECNKPVACAAIEAMGRVALRLPSTANMVLQYFLPFLESELDYVRCKCLVVMMDYLRKYSDIAAMRPLLDTLVAVYHQLNFADEESQVALLWVLGEFGEHIEDAPYILEGMCDQILLAATAEFRSQFLTSALKLFFKRPPEMQPVLGIMFKLLLNDFSHADVHDQALLYYRLLRHNVVAAKKIICSSKLDEVVLIKEQNASFCDKLFEEFNTLSVIYNQPSDSFMPQLTATNDDVEEEEEEKTDKMDSDMTNDTLNDDAFDMNEMGQSVQRAFSNDNFELSEDAEIEPQEFQRRWELLSGAAATNATLRLQLTAVPETDVFEEGLEECGVFTLASGNVQGGTRKYYLYAQEEGDNETYFLLELFLKTCGLVDVTVRSDNSHLPQFMNLFKRIMNQF